MLDERLGDEVKITVIATGFKHQKENDERRERMLEQSGLSRSSWSAEPPVTRPVVQPRYAAPAISTPFGDAEEVAKPSMRSTPLAEIPVIKPPVQEMFAGEKSSATVQETDAAERQKPAPGTEAHAVTVPPVFDTHSSMPAREAMPQESVSTPPSAPEPVRPPLVPVPASAFDDDFFRRDRRTVSVSHSDEPVLRTDVRVPTFAGLAPAEPQNDHDELDIPAFLRRGNN